MGDASGQSNTANSFVSNILRVSPAFTIFCPDAAIPQQPNSIETKILAYRYKKNIGTSTCRSFPAKQDTETQRPASTTQTHPPENSILLGYNGHLRSPHGNSEDRQDLAQWQAH
jgi:hypothetical protein